MLAPASLVYFKAANKAICLAFGQDDKFRSAQDEQTINERLGGNLTANELAQVDHLLEVGTTEFTSKQVTPLARAVWCGATIGNITKSPGVSRRDGYTYAAYVCGLAGPTTLIDDLDEIMRRKMAS